MAKQTQLEKQAGQPAGTQKRVSWDDDNAEREVTGPPVQKWEEGKEVRGWYQGVRQLGLPNSHVADFISGEEGENHGTRITTGCPTILYSKLTQLARGTAVKVRCEGKTVTASGQEAWDFTVLQFGEQMSLQGDDSDLPF